MESKGKILVVEDDCELGAALYEFLEISGFEVDSAEDAISAVAKALDNNYDAIALDLSLPCGDGLAVCEKIKSEKPQTAILISTARGQLDDKRMGFESGADDYLAKPYDPEELVWRLSALIRRGKEPRPVASKEPQKSEYAVCEEAKDATRFGAYLKLSEAEFEIFSYLFKHSPRVVSRKELALACHSLANMQTAKTIDVLVGRIRQKMGEDAKEPKYLITARGYGYRWA